MVPVIVLGALLGACGDEDPPTTPDASVAADMRPDRVPDTPGTPDLPSPDATLSADLLVSPDTAAAKYSPVVMVHGVNGSSAN